MKRFSKVGENGLTPPEYLVEECAELIEAIQRYKRGRIDREIVAQEMSHVLMLIKLSMIFLDIPNEVISAYQWELISRYYNVPNDGGHKE